MKQINYLLKQAKYLLKQCQYRSTLGGLAGTVLAVLLSSGCASTPEAPVNITQGCEVVSSKQLDVAIDQAKDNLSRAECLPFFSTNFASLRETAKGDPKADNRAKFAAWLKWANEQGIISVKQSKESYNRYFNETFVSLPSHGHICGYLQRHDPVKDMSRELSQKSEGYNDILGDSAGYYRVHAQYTDMKFMLESVASACQG